MGIPSDCQSCGVRFVCIAQRRKPGNQTGLPFHFTSLLCCRLCYIIGLCAIWITDVRWKWLRRPWSRLQCHVQCLWRLRNSIQLGGNREQRSAWSCKKTVIRWIHPPNWCLGQHGSERLDIKWTATACTENWLLKCFWNELGLLSQRSVWVASPATCQTSV